MAGEGGNYIPIELSERLVKQAQNVWLVALLLVALWPAVMVAAPILEAFGHESSAYPIYKFFSFLCHQQSERSFHLLGQQFAVCARCFGVYFGLFVGFLLYPAVRSLDDIEPPSRIWLFLSTIPVGIDWTLGILNFVENTHASRFITGMILGAVCSLYLVPAFVEIRRNRTFKRLART